MSVESPIDKMLDEEDYRRKIKETFEDYVYENTVGLIEKIEDAVSRLAYRCLNISVRVIIPIHSTYEFAGLKNDIIDVMILESFSMRTVFHELCHNYVNKYCFKGNYMMRYVAYEMYRSYEEPNPEEDICESVAFNVLSELYGYNEIDDYEIMSAVMKIKNAICSILNRGRITRQYVEEVASKIKPLVDFVVNYIDSIDCNAVRIWFKHICPALEERCYIWGESVEH